MSEVPFISIVIPAFNEEKYLPRCLESIEKQVYPRGMFDVIVVDNNSTDRTAAIAREFGATVITEEKQGYVFALKKGMDIAKGEIIVVIDADCRVPEKYLAQITALFTNGKVVAMSAGSKLDTSSIIMGKLSGFLYNLFMQTTFRIGRPNLTGFSCSVRKTAYHEVGGLDTRFSMSPDIDLGLRLKKAGKVIYKKNIHVMTSSRRWETGYIDTLLEYTKGYIFTVWLRKPPPVKQTVIR